MLKYFLNKEIDYKKWDFCIEASNQRIIYALSWYLDIVAPSWSALILERGDSYYAVMPLPEATKFGITYLYQPLFCQQLGIFSISENLKYDEFIDELLKRYSLISSYNFNTENSKKLKFPIDRKLEINKYYTHHLNLNLSYGRIFKGYDRDRKLNLNRSFKANLTLKTGIEIDPLIRLFKDEVANKINGGVSENAYVILKQVYKVLEEKGMGDVYYTYNQFDELDSGGLFINYANKIIYLFSAASKSGRKNNGRTLIIDKIAKEYSDQNYVLDFESHPTETAINHVYKGFGSKESPYFQIRYLNLPFPLNIIKKARMLFYQHVLHFLRPNNKAG
ncbi:hypothetical protein [Adhaeribacter aquaticus]|uniref:hypothetical protein n=1 Tax=Adhaeribacter aquaticus TaxID=299567 RepID=UPI000414F7F3|nr:hypothetical protein [Adhaeribacter aquaticus]